jgi:hypothetical protein
MGGRTSQTTQGTTTTTLPAGQQQNVDLLQQGARDQYLSGGPRFYGGQTYAGPTSQQLAGREGAAGYATGAGQSLVDNYQAGEQFWLNPQNIFNPSNIPGFQQATDSVTQNVNRNLTESVLPAVRTGNIANGTLGGSRGQIAEGLAAGRTGDALAQALAGMNMNAYSQGLGMYNSAANRAPQTYGLGLAPSNTLETVGGQYQSDQQRQIDEAMQRFNFEQLAPLLNLQAFQQLTGTAGQYGGTTNSTQTQRMSGGDGGVTQALGTALTFASLLSHPSFKENIVPATGFLEGLRELEINQWQYKGDGVRHVGPMADQFHQIFGVGDGVTLNAFDLLGVILGSIKELAEKQNARTN